MWRRRCRWLVEHTLGFFFFALTPDVGWGGPPQAVNNRLVVHVTRRHKTFKLYDGRQNPGLEWEEVHLHRPAVWSAASPRPHRPAGPIRIATDLFLTPSTLQLLLTFVVADDRSPCGSRGLHQAELLEMLERWPERMAWR